jgi:hypothetical protein
MRKPFLRIVLLISMIVGLVILPANLAGNKVYADECSYCYEEWLACEEACPWRGEPGHFSCMGVCRQAYEECQINCYCGWCYEPLAPNRNKKPKQ